MLPTTSQMAEHLAGMVRFPTVSYADEDRMDFSVFRDLHQYLEKTYPLLHKTLKKELIGRAALLYKWEAKKTCGKLPLLLMAHQDVVPEGNADAWRFPPYSGTIAENAVWGRGSMDCKSLMMGELEAVEALIRDGFEPDFDLYLAFGYNEEVGTTTEFPSAKLIAEKLAARGVKLGVVVDEGGQMQAGMYGGLSGTMAYIAVSEKGTATYELYKEGKGGHPIKAGKENIMADVAKAVTRIAEYPRPYRIIPEMAEQYRILAPYMGELEPVYADIKNHRDELAHILETENPLTVAKFQTTMAMTQCFASPNPSLLPTRVSVVFNVRMHLPDTAESMLQEYREAIRDIDGVKIRMLIGRSPSESSEIDCDDYRTMEKAIKDLYPEVTVLPSVCIGGTDAYFMHGICDHVYRFSGAVGSKENGPSHAPNEKFMFDNIEAIPKFFYHYITMY